MSYEGRVYVREKDGNVSLKLPNGDMLVFEPEHARKLADDIMRKVAETDELDSFGYQTTLPPHLFEKNP